MRCCKDLGIASELWCAAIFVAENPDSQFTICRDPRFIREFKAQYCVEVFVTNAISKTKSVTLPSLVFAT